MAGIGGVNSLIADRSAQLKAFSTMPAVAEWNNHQISFASDEPHHCTFIPKYLTQKVVNATVEQFAALKGMNEDASNVHGVLPTAPQQFVNSVSHCKHGLDLSDTLCQARLNKQAFLRSEADDAPEPASAFFSPRTPKLLVYNAKGGQKLPGSISRTDTLNLDPSDPDVVRLWSVGTSNLAFYKEVLKRNSVDNKGMDVKCIVHFGHRYPNAYWDGSELVFGDGDGVTFGSFTTDDDVFGHEAGHGIVQNSKANFEYKGQAGALNESFADVTGSVASQWRQKLKAEDAPWLIGDKILLGRGALRSVKAPGTGYHDNPVLGDDPQPATMDAYQNLPNTEAGDNGGVHINSGIPNKAFYLVATRLGGYSWEKAYPIWYNAMNSGNVKYNSTFKDFAKATVAAAEAMFGKDSKEASIVRHAWADVKVML